jgi:FAD/FMN-containing dehydrogenase
MTPILEETKRPHAARHAPKPFLPPAKRPIPRACPNPAPDGIVVNDVHSRLNETRVHRIARPDSIEAIQGLIQRATIEGRPVSIAGGRHAMGGQQFGAGSLLVDMGAMNRVRRFDPVRGQIEVQAGIHWPALLAYLERAQQGRWPQWGIRQKQTGADRLSLGGSLAANVHGRGLRFKPMISDVEAFTLVDPDGRLRTCSRTQNSELFKLAIGGYGLFGVIATVTLRLAPRKKVQRVVKIIDIEELVPAIAQRIADGFLYGDLQFAIDPHSDHFLRKGVFSCYQPIDDDAEMPEQVRELRADDWMRLLHLAHTDKSRAYELYSTYYLSTHGQRYWSDSHQLSEYVDDYHKRLDSQLGPSGCGTEMISEIYVPRDALSRFIEDARYDLRATGADPIYGTIRFIEKDDESYLAWAKDRYSCIIFNLHTAHTPAALEKTAQDFRALIDRAIRYGGSYYLTYHRWATRDQVEACYPQFRSFLKLKRTYDPEERFQSEWYRHYKTMFAGLP